MKLDRFERAKQLSRYTTLNGAKAMREGHGCLILGVPEEDDFTS